MKFEAIGEGVTMFLGDCRELLPTLDRTCSIVTDNPYGMDWDTDSSRFSGGDPEKSQRSQDQAKGKNSGRRDWGGVENDNEPFDPVPWLEFRSTVLWGANHFANRLPVGRMLLWLKKPPANFGTFLSDFEVGWASGGHGCFAHFRQFPPPSRMVENDGISVGHPTQKPISLMSWCISEFARGSQPIIDPYAGSGTTGVAAVGLGRSFIGIEKDSRYFETACRRISQALARPRLFVDQPQAKPTQGFLGFENVEG